MRTRMWLGIAAVNGALAVALGAFGAHGLAGKVPPSDISAFQTGAQYHMYHALALLAVGFLGGREDGAAAALAISRWSFLLGILAFSGSLYYLGVTGSRALVWMTPLGGSAFIVGWGAMAWDGFARRTRP